MIVYCPKCRLCYDYKVGKHYTCSCGAEFIIDDSGEVHLLESAGGAATPPQIQNVSEDASAPSPSGIGPAAGSIGPKHPNSRLSYIKWGAIFLALTVALVFWFCPGGMTGVLARLGNAEAQFNLGVCYENGKKGVPRDLEQAVYWWREAAAKGHAEAQFNLGNCYSKGLGVPENPEQAAFWWREAAEQGYAPAQYHLGMHYDDYRYIWNDPEKAAYWYRKAAEQGFEPARKALKNLGR